MKKLITNLGFAIALLAFLFVAPAANADTTTNHNPVEQCGNVSVEIKGFGAGLMHQPRPIALAGEHIKAVDIAQNCAVVSWVTDMPATSQVIFAEAEDNTVHMDATEENLGFPRATTQNNSAYVAHDAVLKNLTPGKAYVYRVVSRSHPTATPSVSEPRILVMPGQVVLPGPAPVAPIAIPSVTPAVQESTITQVPPVQYVTEAVVEEKQVTITKVEEVEEVTATATPVVEIVEKDDGLEMLEGVPAAVTAATDLQSRGTLWQRLKQAFSFFGRSDVAEEAEEEVAEETMTEEEIVAEEITEEETAIDVGGFATRVGFLIPTLFILLFIFLLQQIALPMLGIIVERPLIFWMFSVIIAGIAGGLLKYYKVTLVMIAVFLALLAWYLLTEATEEVNAKEEVKPA